MGAAVNDNPVRIARIQAGYSQAAFSAAVGISRPSLNAIEDGRTQLPSLEVASSMEAVLGVDKGTVMRALRAWRKLRDEQQVARMTPAQQATLTMDPAALETAFPTFQAWREVFADTTHAFAKILGINHAVTSGYETGIRQRGMPESMQRALMVSLQITPAYLVALMNLEPSKVVEQERVG